MTDDIILCGLTSKADVNNDPCSRDLSLSYIFRCNNKVKFDAEQSTELLCVISRRNFQFLFLYVNASSNKT